MIGSAKVAEHVFLICLPAYSFMTKASLSHTRLVTNGFRDTTTILHSTRIEDVILMSYIQVEYNGVRDEVCSIREEGGSEGFCICIASAAPILCSATTIQLHV